MPTDNVLIQVNTAANMAGIETAKAGLLGLSGQMVLLTAAFAILYKVGNDGIANFKAQEEAVKSLEQAYASQGLTYAANSAALEEFIATNARFISNQYDVMTAMAGLIRAGNSQTDAIRILNDSLDLAAIKHEDVSAASKTLTLVLAGNSRALRELGITTVQYNAIMKDKTLTIEQKHLALLALIEAKTKEGRNTVDEYTQSQNELNKSWQDATGQAGGPLIGLLTNINKALSTGVQIMDLYLQLMNKIRNLSLGGLNNPIVMPAGINSRGQPTHTAVGPPASGSPNIHVYVSGLADGPAIDRMTTAIVQRLRFTPGL